MTVLQWRKARLVRGGMAGRVAVVRPGRAVEIPPLAHELVWDLRVVSVVSWCAVCVAYARRVWVCAWLVRAVHIVWECECVGTKEIYMIIYDASDEWDTFRAELLIFERKAAHYTDVHAKKEWYV